MNNPLKKINKSFARLQKRVFGQTKVPGLLGRADGTVVAGDGLVYVTLRNGDVIVVSNAKVPNRPYMKVWIGKDEYNPSMMQVLSERYVYGKPLTASLPLHGEKHQWPNEDAVWVEGNQFLPLLAQPGDTGDFYVKLRAAIIKWMDGTKYVRIQPPELNLSSLVPTDGAIYALLQVDDTGTLTAKAGTQVEAPELLTMDEVPLPDAGQLELWAVRLYSGMDRIHKDKQVNDFVDLRWGRGSGTATGDVVGPASATDGNLAVFDGVTGKLLKDGGAPLTEAAALMALISEGAEEIANGNFDVDATGWTVGTGWAWESDGAGGGRMRHTAGNTDPLYYDGSLIEIAAYKFSFSIGGGSAGSVDAYLDDGSGYSFPYDISSTCRGVGRWFENLAAKIVLYPSYDFDGYIDFVSVKRAPSIQEVESSSVGSNLVYGRTASSWAVAPEEAAQDGKLYARKDGAWVEVTGASGSFATADSKTVTVVGGLITDIV